MAHLTVKDGYHQLADRLNLLPQGAPPTDLLFGILKVLADEREAGLLSRLPVRPFTAGKAALAWHCSLPEAEKILGDLCDRCLLLDTASGEETIYMMPPPMAGFFEFSMMRLRGDIDQKLLSELFHQYITVEDDFMLDLLGKGRTSVGRSYVNEDALAKDSNLFVLDYEKASSIIRDASHIGVGLCYCRHKASHTVGACAAPLDICMTFGGTADSLIRHGSARRVETGEGIELLAKAYEHNLVQFGENVQRQPSFICNCCGCCCEALMAARRFSLLNTIATTNFLPSVDRQSCTGCGRCVSSCPVEAVSLVSANDPERPQRKVAKVHGQVCLGCGLCVRACRTGQALRLKPRSVRVITPVNGAHRVVLMAIERNKLQNLIFDNQAHLSHRTMAAILGVILRLPPARQILAGEQMRSRYLAALLAKSKT